MSGDEGYIKFQCHWTPAPLPDAVAADAIDTWRRPLHQAGLIGEFPDTHIGFGNISIRSGEPGQFLISGTRTGGLPQTDASHYALVTAFSMDENFVRCLGPVRASSEALTHAAIYQLDLLIGAVVHVHSSRLWRKYLHELPTTDPEVAYGTPHMAREFQRLYRETDLRETRLAVMGGHEAGLLGFGRTLESAAKRLLSL